MRNCLNTTKRPSNLDLKMKTRKKARSLSLSLVLTPGQRPIHRLPSGGDGFGFVARGRPGFWAAGGAGDGKDILRGENLVGPLLVGRVVGGDSPFAAGAECARDLGQKLRMHEAALGVPGFRPGVGEHEK